MFSDAYSVLCNVSKACDRKSFVHNGSFVTLSEFSNDVARYVKFFSNIDADKIIIYIENDVYLFYVLFMAVLHAGKDVVLPAYLTGENATDLLAISNVLIVNDILDNDDLFSEFNFINVKDLTLEDDIVKLSPISQNQVVYFFTSGSTSKPKSIEKKFSTLANEVALLAKVQFDVWKENPVVLSSAMPNHIYGMFWRFFVPLCLGLVQDLDTLLFPEEICDKQKKYDKVAFVTTPSFMKEISRYVNQYEFKKNCIAIYSSGSLLMPDVSSVMYDVFGVSPFEIFGSTETGCIAYRQQINGNYWNVVPDVELSLNEDKCFVVVSDRTCVVPFVMSDVISDFDGKKFILNGRKDRLVKIAEERVSLPSMEQKLLEHEYVEQVAIVPMDDGRRMTLGCVLVLSEDGKNEIIRIGKLDFVRLIKDYLKNWFSVVTLPKKFRIVNKMPLNPQGKLLLRNLLNLFDDSISEPIMKNMKFSHDKISGDFVFLPEADYFKGHFDEQPILPGVVQIHFVFYFLEKHFGENVKKYVVSKLKFMNLIFPNDVVHFEMVKKSDTRYVFTYSIGNKMCSSGNIEIGDEIDV